MTDFDTLFDVLVRRAIGFDDLRRFSRPNSSFPPYNIISVNDDVTEIHVALAGYSKEDINVFERNGVLHVESNGQPSDDDETYRYRGIAKRAFTLTIAIGATNQVTAGAFENGMLVIRVEKTYANDKMIDVGESLPAIERNKVSKLELPDKEAAA